jgi:hypothetical protein
MREPDPHADRWFIPASDSLGKIAGDHQPDVIERMFAGREPAAQSPTETVANKSPAIAEVKHDEETP